MITIALIYLALAAYSAAEYIGERRSWEALDIHDSYVAIAAGLGWPIRAWTCLFR